MYLEPRGAQQLMIRDPHCRDAVLRAESISSTKLADRSAQRLPYLNKKYRRRWERRLLPQPGIYVLCKISWDRHLTTKIDGGIAENESVITRGIVIGRGRGMAGDPRRN
jgi:hypothetical protein